MPDPVTHLSLGFVIARHFFKDHKPLFLCSCMAPDIDGLIGLVYLFFVVPANTPTIEMKRIFETFHPSLPASLFFLPVFVWLLIIVFRTLNRKWVPAAFSRAYLLVLTAVSLHLGLDLLMTGNRPFWPLSIEAGLGVIPYSHWGVVVPMTIGLALVAIDWVFFKPGKK
jgi:membrane-bound metal-dependent hydrolase YbcI (DUF457 family)